MHMVRQNDPSIDMKPGLRPSKPHGRAKTVDMPTQQIAFPVEQIYREETSRPARDDDDTPSCPPNVAHAQRAKQ